MHQSKYPNMFGLALFIICLFFGPAVLAQETEELINHNQNTDELTQGLDGHLPSIHPRESHKDSVVVKPIAARPKTTEAPAKGKTDDEPLSFNFLFYIIQKFKGTDVVE